MGEAERVTSGTIRAALRDLLPVSEYALMFEVRDSTGHSGRRSADAIAMNLWPSRGLHVEGFEIKVTRSDWLSELKKPQKAEVIAAYCDRWWIATVPGVVKEGELPPTWGLMELRGGRLVRVKQGPVLEAKPLDRGFMAAMLRRASGADASEVQAMAERLIKPEREAIQARIEREVTQQTRTLRERAAQLDGIEEKLGIKFRTWDTPETFARNFHMAQRLGVGGFGLIQGLETSASELLKAIRELSGVDSPA